MECKHQVFVSSTYKDLIDERKEVIHALLELDCIPAGMELFPATDEDAWSLIQEVIDDSDYYLLILAGKYGSTNKDGIGYTEMEFDYAASQGKPIICFVHSDLDSLSAGKVEKTEKATELLNKFRGKAQAKHCKFWTSSPDLGGKISRSLVQLKKKHPSEGWVPGRYAADQAMLTEMERLRARVSELEILALTHNDSPPSDIDELQHGEDVLPLFFTIKSDKSGKEKQVKLEVSWDKIFKYCGPILVGECNNSELDEKIQMSYYHAIPSEYVEYNDFADVILPEVRHDKIKMQLQALGLMEHGIKKRTVSDTKTYWKMTKYGEKYLVKISAIRKH